MAEQKDKPTGPADRPQAAQDAGAAETEEWVYTYDTATGEVTKVERLDPSGQRHELTEEEYAALAGFDPADYPAAADYPLDATYDPYTSDYAASAYDPYGYEEGYWAGWADAGGAAPAGDGYGATPQEQAYYQGVMDYMTWGG
jgi:hypothetical protein